MDPEELAQELIRALGSADAVRRELTGSTDPEDRAVLAAMDRQDGGLLSRVKGLGKQLGAGATDFATSLSRVAEKSPPGLLLEAAGKLPGVAAPSEFRRGVEARQEAIDTPPSGALETGARLTGRILPEFLTAGGAYKAAGKLGATGLGRVLAGNLPPALTFSTNRDESIAGQVAGMTGNETAGRVADNPLTRFGVEYAANIAGEGLLRGAGRLAKSFRGGPIAEEAGRITAIEGMGKQAEELAGAAKRTKGPLADIFDEAAQKRRRDLIEARMPDVADIDIDKELNIAKWSGGDEQLANRMRESGKRVFAEHGLDLKSKRTKEMVEALAREFELDPATVFKKAPKDLSDAEFLMLRNMGNEMVGRAEKAAATMADHAALPSERALAEIEYRNASAMLDRAVYSHMTGQAETARTLGSMRYIGTKSNKPFTWLVEAARTAGRDLTDVERESVLRLAREAQADPSKIGRVASEIAKLRQSTLGEQFSTAWRAGLLYQPFTHMANIVGNTTMLGLETVKDVPAAVVDRALSALTGSRTKTTSIGQVGAALRGVGAGLKQSMKVISGDIVPESIEKIDIPRQVNYDSALLQTYTQLPFRFLEAGDRPFLEANLQRSLHEQAVLLTKQAGLRGRAQVKRVYDILRNPSDRMALEAIADTELARSRQIADQASKVATFRNRGAVASSAGKFREALGPVGPYIIPFSTTPANIGARTFEYSPLGFIGGVGELTGRGLLKLLKGSSGMTPDVQRRIVETIGRSTVGSAPIVAGMVLAHFGRMTPSMPTNQSERDQMYLEGRLPNAVLVNGRWRSVERVSPIGNLVALGADMYFKFKDPELSTSSAVAGSAFGAVKTLTEQPFLTGTKQFLEAVTSPERAGKLAETFAGSLAGPLAGVARSTDPVIREKENPIQGLEAAIPGLSKRLPARIDQFGQEARRGTTGLPYHFELLRSSPDKRLNDPVIAEMSRLDVELTNRRRDRKDGETAREFEARATAEGTELVNALDRLIAGRGYRGADDDRKKFYMERTIERLRNRQTKLRQFQVTRSTPPATAGVLPTPSLLPLPPAPAYASRPFPDPQREQVFQEAYRSVASRLGLDLNPDNPEHHYDYRAAWEAGQMVPNKSGHFPSRFKFPDHPNRFVNGIDTITGLPVGAGLASPKRTKLRHREAANAE